MAISASNTSTVTYDRVTSSTTATTVKTRSEVESVGTDGVTKQVFTITADDAAVANVYTVTVTAGSVDDVYYVKVVDNVNATPCPPAVYLQATGDTATTIANNLVQLLNANPLIRATNAAGVITVTSEYPGRELTITNTKSTTVGNVVISEVTPESGVATTRKLCDLYTKLITNDAGYVEVQGRVDTYDVDGSTVLTTGSYGRVGSQHTKTLNAFQADAGQ